MREKLTKIKKNSETRSDVNVSREKRKKKNKISR